MNYRALFVAVIISVALTPILGAAGVREVAGHQYIRDGARWMQQDPDGSKYLVDGEVITVKFRSTVGPAAQEALHRRLGGTELRRAATGFVDVKVSGRQDVLDAVEAYLATGLVEIAEPTTIGEYTATPNDTQYGSQWHLPQVLAPATWDDETGDPAVIIAVLDSGTEFDHEDLGLGPDSYQNVWLNPGEDAWTDPNDPSTGNGVDDDLNGLIDDWKGWDFDGGNNDPRGTFFHGTAVAGVAAAKTNNALGVAGIAGGWNNAGASILIGGVGNTSPNGAVLDDAILYAAGEGAHVVQLSLSVGQSSAIDAAIDMAYDNFNVTIICSSGNGGGPSVSYPSSHPNVIAVGATDESDLRAGFSQHGPLLEVSAPGTNILTLDLNDGYGTTGGTSFSSPLTSGVVALMVATNPNLTNTEIRQILHDTADKVGGYDYNWDATMPGHSFELGYGRVNALQALAAAATGIFADGFEAGDTSAWSLTAP